MNQEELRQNARSTLARLSDSGALPVLPAAAIAGMAIAREPDSDLDKLCRVIESDVGLAARVLRVANSLGFGRCAQAKTIRDAVITTGTNTACEILVAASVRELYGAWGSSGGTLWNHALVVALAAEHLAEMTGLVEPGTAFLPGLFHDVGRLVFLLVDRAAFETIEKLAPASGDEQISHERFWFGFDHSLASGILAEDWGLTAKQCDAISWHHEFANADAGRELALLLAASDGLAHMAGFASGSERSAEINLTYLGLAPEQSVDCAQRVLEAFEVHKRLLG